MDVIRETPLYDESLVVKIPTSANDVTAHRDTNLTFRILEGRNRMLHFELTDDHDPYFLYLLQLTEQDFPTLKREQSILVDFAAFPAQLIELLKLVTDGNGTSSASAGEGGVEDAAMSSTEPLQATLPAGGNGPNDNLAYSCKMDLNSGQFSILESNQFKETTHITLQLRPGNDAAIKAYLASRHGHTSKLHKLVSQEVESLQDQLDRETTQRRELQEALEELQRKRDLDLHSTRNAHAEEIIQVQSKLNEKHDEQKQNLQQQLTQWMLKHDESNEKAATRITELEVALQAERDEKHRNEIAMREFSRNKENYDNEREGMTSEMSDMRITLRQSETERTKAEREVVKLQMKVEGLEGQLSEKHAAMKQAEDLKRAHEDARKSADDQLELYRTSLEAVNEKLLTAINEIKKGNQEISRQQQEISGLKDKTVSKSEVIRKQEALIVELRSKLSESQRENINLENQTNGEKADAVALRRELDKAKERLNESANIIQTNQEVITWLNREISRYQLSGGVGPLGAESYMYEQSSPDSVFMMTESPVPSTGVHKTKTTSSIDSKVAASYDYLKKHSALKGLEGIVEESKTGGDGTDLDVTAGGEGGYYAGVPLFGSEGSKTARMY